MTLENRNVLIIGATSGIGLTTGRLVEAEGGLLYQASRSAPAGPRSVQVEASQPFAFPEGFLPEQLHGLVYCPGTINLKPINRVTPEALLQEFTLNTVGAFRALQLCLRPLKASGGASVVFFGTVAAKVGMPFHASISAAKGGLEAMARSLAAELAPGHIRVNVIAPSLTDTPLASALLDTPDKRESGSKRHPLGRVGTPDDLAQAALYLLSPASGWVTGQTLGVDGGMGSLR